MKHVSAGTRTIHFGTFELDPNAGELRRRGQKIRLQEQPLRILELLLARPGELVTREELRAALWSNHTLVDFDHGLNRAINKLREALGDSAESPRFIETLARRGYRFLGDPKSGSSPLHSLLVLPLENLSRDPEQSYFADGLTEALTTTLAKISALRVLSRTTAVHYQRAQKTLPEIARELGVDEVVEGSVYRSQHRVRVTVQLVHAPTDTHLWAESYDRDLRDLLALQAEIANAITREIRVKLTPQEVTQLARTAAVDPQAYDAYLQGLRYWDKRSPEAMRKAIASYEQAVSLDPNLAVAHAGLAQCFNVLGWYGYAAPLNGCARAKALAARALAIDPNLAQAHAAMGWAVMYYEYDFVTAETEYRQALALDPNDAVAHYRLALRLAYVGQLEEAIAENKLAISLDPHSVTTSACLDLVYWLGGRFEALLAHAKRGVDVNPEVPHTHWALGWAYQEVGNLDAALVEFQAAAHCAEGATIFIAMQAEACALAGKVSEALAILQQLLARSNEQYVTPYMIARVYAALALKDEALNWLETAFQERAAWMVQLDRDPRLASLRSEPRFESLRRQMNFPRCIYPV